MTHYEVLGVDRTAAPAEIRRAYVQLARQHHPDFHTGGGAGERAAAERRMRDVNEAWRVLSDADLRRRYDGGAGPQRLAAEERPPNSPGAAWVPPDDGDDWDPSMLDDTPINPVKPKAALTFAPVVLFLVGMVLLLFGVVISLAPLLALGVMAVVLSGVLFLVVPLVTMSESRRRDLAD